MSCTSFCVYTLLVIIWFSRFLYRIFALYRNKIVDNVRQNVVNPTIVVPCGLLIKSRYNGA